MSRLNRLLFVPVKVAAQVQCASQVCHIPVMCFSSLKERSKQNNQLIRPGELYMQVRNSQKWVKVEKRKKYTLSAKELKKAAEEDTIYLIDVREPSEVQKGKVPSKRYVNLPIGVFSSSLSLSDIEFENKFGASKPKKDDTVVFMCRRGVRSTFALQLGQDSGYKNSKHFPGGWTEWKKLYGDN